MKPRSTISSAAVPPLACYQGNLEGRSFRFGALNVLTLCGGRIAEMTGFLDPGIHDQFGLPKELADWDRQRMSQLFGVDR